MSLPSPEFLAEDLVLPLVIGGGLRKSFKLPNQVVLVEDPSNLAPDKPYLCLYMWEDFIPNKLDLFYESVRKQHQVFSKTVVYARVGELKKEHQYFLKELGVEKIIHATPDNHSLEKYFEQEVFEAEKIGSYYYYIYQIGQLIEAKNLEKLGDELNKYVIVELLNPKTFLFIKALLVLGQRFKAKTLLKQVLAEDPKCLWAAHQLSMVYLKDSDYRNMLELMERLNQYHCFNPQRNYYLGNIHFHLEDYERSLKLFKQSRKLFPQFASRFDEGVAKNRLALDLDSEEVQRSLQGKSLSNDFIEFLSAYVQRFYTKGKYEQSERLLKIALKSHGIESLHQRIFYNLSILYGTMGNRKACEECCKKCMAGKGAVLSEALALEKGLQKIREDSWKEAFSKLRLPLLSFAPRNLENKDLNRERI
ncbi:MAG: tetratricopeptide repeat protein [Oligoflexales bacterium]|nr:tetratricopeptide repeat protein [Oligoflexales bacterium]